MIAGLTLAIDGATGSASVALVDGACVLAERTLPARNPQSAGGGGAELLMPAIADCLRDAGVDGSALAQIVCGAGPGSFTGLRVAASIGKGLAAGYGIGMHSVPSLLLTVAAYNPPVAAGSYTSVLGAMRGEWFAAEVRVLDGAAPQLTGPVTRISAEQLASASQPGALTRIIGPGQTIDAVPHARGVCALLGSRAISEVNISSWEPDYGRLAEAQVKWEAAHGRALSP